jgi:hypothetical protein
MAKSTKKTKKITEEKYQPTKLSLTVAALGAVTIALFGVIAVVFK